MSVDWELNIGSCTKQYHDLSVTQRRSLVAECAAKLSRPESKPKQARGLEAEVEVTDHDGAVRIRVHYDYRRRMPLRNLMIIRCVVRL